MSDGLEIRRYEPEDAEDVWQIHERALRASPIEFVADASADEDLRDVSGEYLDVGGEFLVGTVGGEVVATGGFVPGDSDGTAELRRIRVHPDHQRNGYGEMLVTELERRAVQRGFDRLALETNERLRAARRLYENRGYEQVGTETRPATGDEIVRYRKDA